MHQSRPEPTMHTFVFLLLVFIVGIGAKELVQTVNLSTAARERARALQQLLERVHEPVAVHSHVSGHLCASEQGKGEGVISGSMGMRLRPQLPDISAHYHDHTVSVVRVRNSALGRVSLWEQENDTGAAVLVRDLSATL